MAKQEFGEVIDLTGGSAAQRPRPPPGTIILPNSDSDDDDVVVIGQSFNSVATDSKLPVKGEPLSDPSNSQCSPLHVLHDIDIGTEFNSFDDGQAAVYALESSRGHAWHIGQSKKVNGVTRRTTLRCNHYYQHTPTHLSTIDPSDYRNGKTIKTSCMAHVNLCRSANGTWRVSMTDWKHNHPAQLPPGGVAARPPTQEQQALVSDLWLTLPSETEHGWRHALRLNDQQVVVGFWWQSPIQASFLCCASFGTLTKRFGDVLLNDSSYNRNRYGYPLDIGIVIDGFGKSRNAWYSFHEREDIETHCWVLQQHLDSAGYSPDVFGSDRHGSLIGAREQTMPTTCCLHHLDTNVNSNLRSTLSQVWNQFRNDFWALYRAVSPTAQPYLDEELYHCRQHWAWAWVGSIFTAGARTSGRVESENRVNKAIGGPKKTLLDLFRGLNEHTNDQKIQDLIRHRDQHASTVETLFLPIIKAIREHGGPYANQKSRREMDESMFYTAEVVQLPSGKRQWVQSRFVYSPKEFS
ncbi:hypothetical protein B0H14DRAFT_2352759 [Mycena olivaceomarginata]|nr:hypothetical protein B0H14DRAFT_2352759 [Mycena olivaceomarginata]